MTSTTLFLEMSLISAAIKWGSRELQDKIETLRAEDFVTDSLRSIYEKLRDSDYNARIAYSRLTDEEDRLLFEKAASEPSYISEFDSLSERLKEFSQSRRLKNRLMDIVMTDDNVICSSEYIREIANEEDKDDMSGSVSLDYIDSFVNNLDKKNDCIMTGFEELDKRFGGFQVPSVCIIGARPSTGKTTLSLNIAENIARKQNKKVLYFSLEMGARQIIERLISNHESILYEKFTSHTLTESDKEKCVNYANWLKEKNLVIIDNKYKIENIAVAVRREKPDVVMIDFIQLISTMKRFGNTRETINHISSEIKQMAKANNCTVIVLSQLRRNELDPEKPPRMSDLKESGSLEADGDYVMLLHRPYVLDKMNNKSDQSTTQLMIDKNKYGNCGLFNLAFRGEIQRFSFVSE